MNKYLVILPLASALILSSAAMADNGAGCGLGQQVFAGQTGLGPHVLAATTNGTSSNQLFGLSFDSLGCNGQSMITAEYQRNQYVAGNFDNLARDAAKGNGAHLQALGELLRIDSDDQAVFNRMTQEKHAQLFSENPSDAQTWLAQLDAALGADPRLAKYAGR
ncbi:MAG: DUF3015 family protein [Thiotrichales bacterium]